MTPLGDPRYHAAVRRTIGPWSSGRRAEREARERSSDHGDCVEDGARGRRDDGACADAPACRVADDSDERPSATKGPIQLLGLRPYANVAALRRISAAELRHLFSKPAQLVRALVAINVLPPAIAIAVCKTFSLHPAVIVGLVTRSMAPVSNLFPQAMLPLLAPARTAYEYGLSFASTVLSVILTRREVGTVDRRRSRRQQGTRQVSRRDGAPESSLTRLEARHVK
jgi:hypothetical protein